MNEEILRRLGNKDIEGASSLLSGFQEGHIQILEQLVASDELSIEKKGHYQGILDRYEQRRRNQRHKGDGGN